VLAIYRFLDKHLAAELTATATKLSSTAISGKRSAGFVIREHHQVFTCSSCMAFFFETLIVHLIDIGHV